MTGNNLIFAPGVAAGAALGALPEDRVQQLEPRHAPAVAVAHRVRHPAARDGGAAGGLGADGHAISSGAGAVRAVRAALDRLCKRRCKEDRGTEHRDTEIQTQRHRDTEAQRHRGTEAQRHTDTQTHRHTDTQTHRHTEIQTQRHTDTQTHRHRGTYQLGDGARRHALPSQLRRDNG